MSVTSVYPVLMSRDVAAAADFYRRAFAFETTFEADWYASLRVGAFELAILAYDHDTVPSAHRELARGVIVNIEVDDVDEVHRRFIAGSHAPIVLSLRSEDFGQRHFIARGPDDVLVDVIQPIAPRGEFADAFAAGEEPGEK